MESLKKVVVTGCNKGVGYGIIRNLFQKPYKIIMACRSLESAKKSKADLEKEFPQAQGQLFLQELDVSNFKSIESFVKNISQVPLILFFSYIGTLILNFIYEFNVSNNFFENVLNCVHVLNFIIIFIFNPSGIRYN